MNTHTDIAERLLQFVVRDRWARIGQTTPCIYLFGAGRHTRWLLEIVRGFPGPRITAILDDAATPHATLDGHRVLTPASVTFTPSDSILVSTDDPASPLPARCAALAPAATLIRLYDGMPDGPYPKGDATSPSAPDVDLPAEIHARRLRLSSGLQRFFRLLLPMLHPWLAAEFRRQYAACDQLPIPVDRQRREEILQAVRDVFYPPSHRFIRTTRPGALELELALNLCEVESGNLFFGRDFETLERNIVASILRPGDCVFDGGAHVGLFSLLASRHVGPKGRVHAFEANPAVNALLLQNIALNQADNITPPGLALARKDGELTFCINEDTTLSSLGENGRGRILRRQTVQATCLDSYWQRAGSPRVALLKLDLEGFEWDALRGAEQMLAGTPELTVLCELAPRNIRPRGIVLSDVLTWIRAQGFAIWEIDARRQCLRRVDDGQPVCGHINYFFARPASAAAARLDELTNGITGGHTA